jgi:hypothetical protein
MARHLERNAEWLRARPRYSDDIEAALYPDYSLGGMEHDVVRQLLNAALWNAGYSPDDTMSDNPKWSWSEDEAPTVEPLSLRMLRTKK